MKEIGSEFWKPELTDVPKRRFDNGTAFLMSGRTALDFIIKDIKSVRRIQKAYMPSYCCDSMIQPFVANEIDVEFYDVVIDKDKGLVKKIELQNDCDIVFLINYFGFIDPETEVYAEKFRNNGKIVIKDMTHSVFSEKYEWFDGGYTFASLRKWTALSSGAFAYSRSGFGVSAPLQTNAEYIKKRKEAAAEKALYMEGAGGSKEKFLGRFNLAEGLLDTDYSEYSIDAEAKACIQYLDTEYICRKRKNNGKRLLKGLEECSCLRAVYNEIKDDEVPLFIPVAVKPGLRDELKRFLVEKQIYLPIHWPLTSLHSISQQAKGIYENVLSVVCDQRYDLDDMDHIIEVIKEFEVKKCR